MMVVVPNKPKQYYLKKHEEKILSSVEAQKFIPTK